jgi:sulfur relay (sulfurtransferase) complex TusBCD TusD component (DsrE family)
MTATKTALTIPGLETVYDARATAIDQAGHDKAELFLVKLALLNANALANPQTFDAHVQAALRDL